MFVTGYRKYSALSGGMWKVESGILNKGIDFLYMGQLENDMKIPFPVVHFILIGWECTVYQLYLLIGWEVWQKEITGSEAYLVWKEN